MTIVCTECKYNRYFSDKETYIRHCKQLHFSPKKITYELFTEKKYSYEKISEVLDLSKKTVRKYVREMRRKDFKRRYGEQVLPNRR